MFTNSPLSTLEAETAHRAHAFVEQVIADLKNGPLAHLPYGQFGANGAWLVCAAMAFNLTRAAGRLASAFHAKATTGTIRAQLITIPGRLARSARRLTLHLPTGWPWQTAWHQLATADRSPPDHHPPSDRTRPDTAVETAGPPGHPATSTHHHPARSKITPPA